MNIEYWLAQLRQAVEHTPQQLTSPGRVLGRNVGEPLNGHVTVWIGCTGPDVYAFFFTRDRDAIVTDGISRWNGEVTRAVTVFDVPGVVLDLAKTSARDAFNLPRWEIPWNA